MKEPSRRLKKIYIDILAALENGEDAKRLAERYRFSKWAIYSIQRRYRVWFHMKRTAQICTIKNRRISPILM